MHKEMLSYCNTCMIIRPPRSFHCSECCVCVEVHDHHCPFMGTCVGRRNTRYFVLFLVSASFICLETFVLCLTAMLTSPESFLFSKDEDQKGWQYYEQLVGFIIMLYTGMLALSLIGFAVETNHKVMSNVTTNESIRKKWNAKGN